MTTNAALLERLERIEGKLDLLHEELADLTLSRADLGALDRAEDDLRDGRVREL